MSIEAPKYCPDQLVYYLIPHPQFGGVIVCRVPTPAAFKYNGWDQYEEGDDVFWDNRKWYCLEWNFERNEFVLTDYENHAFDDPAARRELLEIIYGVGIEFQMSLFSCA